MQDEYQRKKKKTPVTGQIGADSVFKTGRQKILSVPEFSKAQSKKKLIFTGEKNAKTHGDCDSPTIKGD